MATGRFLPCPHCGCALSYLEGVTGSTEAAPFSVQFVRIPYDIERAIHGAQAVQMPELEAYADELRTARYRGLPKLAPVS